MTKQSAAPIILNPNTPGLGTKPTDSELGPPQQHKGEEARRFQLSEVARGLTEGLNRGDLSPKEFADQAESNGLPADSSLMQEKSALFDTYNASIGGISRAEGLRDRCSKKISLLFKYGLLPEHPSGTDRVADRIKQCDIYVGRPDIGLSKGQKGHYNPLNHRLTVDGSVHATMHELVHASLESPQLALRRFAGSSLEEAVVEYIAFMGANITSKNWLEEHSLDGETPQETAIRCFKDLKGADLNGAGYQSDIKLLLEICDHDFAKLSTFFEALFGDPADPTELDGFGNLMDALGDEWGADIGLEDTGCALLQINAVIDGKSEKSRGLVDRLIATLNPPEELTIVCSEARTIKIDTCRWAILEQKGKHEEAVELKRKIIRDACAILVGLASRESLLRVSANSR